MLQRTIDVLPSARPEDVGMSSERLADIERTLTDHVERGRLPGAVVAVARRDRLVSFAAIGYRDPARGVPMTTDTLFWIASMTKPLTVVAALTLVEQGKLLLGEPVSAYLPQFGERQVARVVPDAAGEPAIETVPARRQPTVLDLMRHTSGIIAGHLESSPIHRLYADAVGNGMTPYTGAEFLERLSRLPLLHQPGEVWHYSFGIELLGLIVESLTGQPLGAYLRESVFGPLGMADTGFGVPADQWSRYAQPLSPDPETGQPLRLPDLTAARFDSGGAGAVSTVGDYLRFACMLENRGALGDTRVLGRKTVEFMTADQLWPGIDDARIGATDPLSAGYGFGLGVAVRRTTGGASVLGSPGDYSWPGSGGTYWWADPSERLVAVFMAATPTRQARTYYSQLVRALVLRAIVD